MKTLFALSVLVLASLSAEAQPAPAVCPSYTASPIVTKPGQCYDLGALVGEVSFTRSCPPRQIRDRAAYGWQDVYFASVPVSVAEYVETETGRYRITKTGERVDSSGLFLTFMHTVLQSSTNLSGYCRYTVTISAE